MLGTSATKRGPTCCVLAIYHDSCTTGKMPSKLQPKRKLWTDENMLGAVKNVQKGKGIRLSARLYNVPVESLRWRVNGAVDVLTLKLYSLKVLFRLVPPFSCISTSAGS